MKKLIFFTIGILFTVLTIANTVTVMNTNDMGANSFRALVGSANDGDTIRFNPSLIATGNDTIKFTSGEVYIDSKSLIIVGIYNSTSRLYMSGVNNNRIISVDNSTNVYLDSLAFIKGNGVGVISNGYGGAVSFFNSDSLFISNCVFENNTAALGGGAIYVTAVPAYVRINNSSLSNNSSLLNGGAIYANASSNGAKIVLNNSTISGSQASSGGAIHCYSMNASSQVIITNSTLTGNNASSLGGAINCTTTGAASFVTLKNSTIAQNSSPTGGAIFCSTSSDISLTSSIIAFNGNSGISNNGFSAVNPLATGYTGYNIFSDTPSGVLPTDSTGIDSLTLRLMPLAYNGGETKTMLPASGSIAINVGNPADMSNAQNGIIIGGRRDVGAAETSTTTEINESIFSDNINIYPNPTNGDFTLELETISNAKILIIDVTGKEVYNLNNITKKQTHISLSGLNKGIYFIKIQEGTNYQTRKLILN